jgi:hypothetical protein
MKKKERIKQLEQKVLELERRLFILETTEPLKPYDGRYIWTEPKIVPLREVKITCEGLGNYGYFTI